MTGLRARTASAPTRSSSQATKPPTKSRVAPVPLLWSAVLRVHQDIFIQASIEYADFFAEFHFAGLYIGLRIGRSRKDNRL